MRLLGIEKHVMKQENMKTFASQCKMSSMFITVYSIATMLVIENVLNIL